MREISPIWAAAVIPAAFAFGIIVSGLAGPGPEPQKLAEKPDGPPVWQGAKIDYPHAGTTRIDVVDLGSVCAYVAMYNGGTEPTMVVIPKAALGQGKGCQ